MHLLTWGVGCLPRVFVAESDRDPSRHLREGHPTTRSSQATSTSWTTTPPSNQHIHNHLPCQLQSQHIKSLPPPPPSTPARILVPPLPLSVSPQVRAYSSSASPASGRRLPRRTMGVHPGFSQGAGWDTDGDLSLVPGALVCHGFKEWNLPLLFLTG